MLKYGSVPVFGFVFFPNVLLMADKQKYYTPVYSVEPLYQYKIILYLWLVASEDTETQRNGIVVIIWGVGEGVPSSEYSDYTSEFFSDRVIIVYMHWLSCFFPLV
jgi:hypothetical protein